MPTITSIKPQRNKKRVNIYLDGKFGFGLDLETFVKLGLKVKQNLDDNQINKILKETEFQKIYDKLLKFASLRPRSEKEYKDWLKRHKVNQSLHQELFNRLKRLEFIDDKRFAIWWVEQRREFKLKSKRDLQFELKQKGVRSEIIDQVLKEEQIDEVEQAKKLLEKKSYLWKGYDDYQKRVKMSAFLARKGFDWEVIRKVITNLDIDLQES